MPSWRPVSVGMAGRREPLVAGERPAVVPLSFAQSRLWFLDRFEGGVATYNMPIAFRISGALDVEALGAALDDVIARHESLRTIFPDIDGVPFQQVVPAEAGMWRRGGAAVVSLPEQDVAGELVALAGYRFDLSAEIPIRAQIYSVGPEQYVVGIVVHHIAFDGWSLAPMVRDVAEAYRARRQGRAPRWAPLPVQYVDYTLWQQEWLGAESDPDSVIAGQLATGGRSWPICPRWCRCRRIGPARRCPVTAVMGWRCASTRRCGRGSRRWRRRITRRPRWCCRRSWRWCCTGSGPVRTW